MADMARSYGSLTDGERLGLLREAVRLVAEDMPVIGCCGYYRRKLTGLLGASASERGDHWKCRCGHDNAVTQPECPTCGDVQDPAYLAAYQRGFEDGRAAPPPADGGTPEAVTKQELHRLLTMCLEGREADRRLREINDKYLGSSAPGRDTGAHGLVASSHRPRVVGRSTGRQLLSVRSTGRAAIDEPVL